MSPLAKRGTKVEQTKRESAERKKRYRARAAAKKKYGEAAIKGKDVHHKDGNNDNNGSKNIGLSSKSSHGKKHGRGNGKKGKGTLKNTRRK